MAHDVVLECNSFSHRVGKTAILHDVNLRVVRGEFVSLVGPSGAGKTSLLQTIVGTLVPSTGKILVYPRSGAAVKSAERGPGRDRGIVYQRYPLFPYLTAQQNVAFGPMFDESTLGERTLGYFNWRQVRRRHLREAAKLLERFGLGNALNKYPHELSGGMCQRVAVAQALIMKPEILLLDEPFGALDEETREDLQRMLLELYEENCQATRAGATPPYTILLVTHELNEAIYVGDRVVGLSRYWDWRSEGHSECPGASIVYDRIAPVFASQDIKRDQAFSAQRAEIRKVVFNPAARYSRHEFVTFWDQLSAGFGEGILSGKP